MNVQQVKSTLTLVCSTEGAQPGEYQREKNKIEKKKHQRWWAHVMTWEEGVSLWQNNGYYLLYEHGQESIYVGSLAMEQLSLFTTEELEQFERK